MRNVTLFTWCRAAALLWQYFEVYALWWPTSRKKRSKSRKNFQNREKNFRIQKHISWSKKKLWNLEKKLKSRKIFQNREKYLTESRKLFQNWEKFSRIKNYFLTRVEKISWISWPRIPFMFQVNNKNMFQVNNKNSRMTSMTLFWYFYC